MFNLIPIMCDYCDHDCTDGVCKMVPSTTVGTKGGQP